MASTTVTRGNVLTTILLQATLTPVATAANSTVEQSFTVLGIQVGDQISALSLQAAYTSLVDSINVRASAANTLTVAFNNNTGGSLTAPAGLYYIEINRPESLPAPVNAV